MAHPVLMILGFYMHFSGSLIFRMANFISFSSAMLSLPQGIDDFEVFEVLISRRLRSLGCSNVKRF